MHTLKKLTAISLILIVQFLTVYCPNDFISESKIIPPSGLAAFCLTKHSLQLIQTHETVQVYAPSTTASQSPKSYHKKSRSSVASSRSLRKPRSTGHKQSKNQPTISRPSFFEEFQNDPALLDYYLSLYKK